MDNLHHQWPQGSAENNKTHNKSAMDNNNKKLLARPPSTKDDAVNCPRCDSTNTKFCYYNNYSLSQPRYFCKGCRRYWTQGGSLRNVPVGGGSRKNRRPLPSPPSIKKVNTSSGGGGGGSFSDPPPPIIANNFNFLDPQNPNNAHHHDLNLGFLPSSSSQSNHYHDVISKGLTLIGSSGNPSSFQFSGGFGNFLDFKPPSSNNSLSFSLDNGGFGSQGFGSFQLGLQEGGGGDGGGGGGGGGGGARVLFPADDLKPVAAVEQNNDRVLQNGDSGGGGYWSSAMLGGGSW